MIFSQRCKLTTYRFFIHSAPSLFLSYSFALSHAAYTHARARAGICSLMYTPFAPSLYLSLLIPGYLLSNTRSHRSDRNLIDHETLVVVGIDEKCCTYYVGMFNEARLPRFSFYKTSAG